MHNISTFDLHDVDSLSTNYTERVQRSLTQLAACLPTTCQVYTIHFFNRLLILYMYMWVFNTIQWSTSQPLAQQCCCTRTNKAGGLVHSWTIERSLYPSVDGKQLGLSGSVFQHNWRFYVYMPVLCTQCHMFVGKSCKGSWPREMSIQDLISTYRYIKEKSHCTIVTRAAKENIHTLMMFLPSNVRCRTYMYVRR